MMSQRRGVQAVNWWIGGRWIGGWYAAVAVLPAPRRRGDPRRDRHVVAAPARLAARLVRRSRSRCVDAARPRPGQQQAMGRRTRGQGGLGPVAEQFAASSEWRVTFSKCSKGLGQAIDTRRAINSTASSRRPSQDASHFDGRLRGEVALARPRRTTTTRTKCSENCGFDQPIALCYNRRMDFLTIGNVTKTLFRRLHGRGGTVTYASVIRSARAAARRFDPRRRLNLVLPMCKGQFTRLTLG